MTSRSGFLGMLGAALAGAALDPERLLWVPGKKLISLPPIAETNTFLTIDMITAEMLAVLSRNTAMVGMVNRSYAQAFETAEKTFRTNRQSAQEFLRRFQTGGRYDILPSAGDFAKVDYKARILS